VKRAQVIIAGKMTGISVIGDRFPEFPEFRNAILGFIAGDDGGIDRPDRSSPRKRPPDTTLMPRHPEKPAQ
jgi:hypothetical protein